MIGRSQAARLILEPWASANDLAHALHVMLSSSSPRKLSAPLEIEADPSRGPALRVVASRDGVAPRRELVAAVAAESLPSRRTSDPSSPPVSPTALAPRRGLAAPDLPDFAGSESESRSPDSRFPGGDAYERPDRRGGDLPGPNPQRPSLSASKADPRPLAATEVSAAQREPDARPVVATEAVATPRAWTNSIPEKIASSVPEVSAPKGFRERSIVNSVAETSRFRAPEPDRFRPVLEFGPTLFSADEPSRFKAAPELWSTEKRAYQPIQEWMRETQDHLMVGTHHYRPLIAKVLPASQAGRIWKCRIWQQSAPPLASDTVDAEYQEHWFEADVLVANLSERSKYLPPVGEYILVVELPDSDGAPDNRFIHVSDVRARIAKTTSAITAGTGTQAGSGTATLIEFEPGQNYSIKESVTVYNTNDEVSNTKIIQVKRIEGYWFVDVARCP